MSDAVGQRQNDDSAPFNAEAGSAAGPVWPRDLAAVLFAGLIGFGLAVMAVLIVLRV